MRTLHRLLLLLAGVALVLLATPAPQASAHPLSTTAVLLDIDTHQVDAKVELPLDELSVATGEELTADSVVEDETLTGLRAYVQQHMSATDDIGQGWSTSVTGGEVEQVDGIDTLVLDATLRPASGTVGGFVLRYDAIIDKVVAHRVFISGRYGDSGTYTTLAMLSWQTTSVPVVAAGATDASAGPAAPRSQGFLAAVHLGVDHISGGSDHLLFLITLLLPAPLLVSGRGRRRRWARREDSGRAAWRVVHVVTAFAVGHSLTLALGALGWVHLPTRVVEAGIALSVLVSAIHAIRPLVRRGEVVIAVGFGLLHGLAFATILTDLDLSGSGLVTTLLGFNVGIEITQLLVVALVMPSLLLLSRTPGYPVARVGLASFAAVLAAAWFAERIGGVSTNPFEPAGELLVDHPWVLAGGLAVLAVTAAALARGRDAHTDEAGASPPTSSSTAVAQVVAGRAAG